MPTGISPGPGGATSAISAGTYDNLLGLYANSRPPDDYSGSSWTMNGVTWLRDPQTGTWGSPTTSDPMIQKLIAAGGLTYGPNGTQVDASKLPSTAYGTFDTMTPTDVTLDANGNPTVDRGGKTSIQSPTDVTWDPNYGWVTPAANIQNKDDWYDTFSGEVLPSLIAAAATAGAGAIGAGVPWYASAGMKALSGNLNTPLGALSALAPGLSDLGIDPSLTTAAQLGLAGAGVANAFGQSQYSPPVAGATTAPQTAGAPPATPGTSAATPTAAPAPAAVSTATNAAPVSTAAAAPDIVPIPESPIPDAFNAQAFGGGSGGGGSSQIISDQGSPVATSVAPQAYDNSSAQIVS